ncbi:urease accessory protein UreF [Ancylothrix sp. C2]|uniref:urease accessory protein UreF n=1 Tax=Ancylothrix sp. D3o TaxID=2953691 RepID=UPI0021BBB469|nr:urease accessory protein UreF [Ancylothrix sp. D3o]MCT7948630.1 urease accessory protein UreF [Ancylothrix sp. D3o]
MTQENLALLSLLQLASPALPVGAYSYSEGLETLIVAEKINNKKTLQNWIEDALKFGSIRLEAAVMVRVYRAMQRDDLEAVKYWNSWATATRETEELRLQSLQMGMSLNRLLVSMQPALEEKLKAWETGCNFAVAFGVAAQNWQIEEKAALLGFLHSWASNLIGAGVKLIPLGQTAGQQLLLSLQSNLISATEEILYLEDDDLSVCSWGLSLASMNHEVLYTRLFRS